MIRRMLLIGVCLVGLFATSAVAEEYPPKEDKVKAESVHKAEKADAAAKPLAKTGSDTTVPMVMVAAGLIVVGGALVTSVRRRRTEAVAATA